MSRINSVSRVLHASANEDRGSMREPHVIDAPTEKMPVLQDASPRRKSENFSDCSERFRPAAPFLAQYIDQHFPWPRAPLRKMRERQRAARAYITADMLSDVLADVLRLKPFDGRF